ncbi:MAG: carboxypeptidase-like regulatory domain-containing protein, partial [Chitinophagaceae bacterium]
MCKPALLTCLFLLAIISAHAQQAIIRGNVSDSSEKRNLHFAVVSLLRKSDTTLAGFTRSNQDGKFVLPKIDTGQYVLLISFPRFADYMESLDIKADTDIGPISLTQKSKLL